MTGCDASEQCTLTVTKANCIVGCINCSTASTPKAAIIPLYSAPVRPHLKYCIQFWTLLVLKDVGRLK